MNVGAWRHGAMAMCWTLATQCTEWSDTNPLIGAWTTTAFSGVSDFGTSAIVSASYTMNFYGDGASVSDCVDEPNNCGTFTARLTINYANDVRGFGGCTYTYSFSGYVWMGNWQQGATVSADGSSGRESFEIYGPSLGSTLTVTNCLAASSDQAPAPGSTQGGVFVGNTTSFDFNGATAIGNLVTAARARAVMFTYGPIEGPP